MTPQSTTAIQVLAAPQVPAALQGSAAPQVPAALQGSALSQVSAAPQPPVTHEHNENSASPEQPEEILANPILMSKGTYSVHHDECYAVPDYYESAYAKRQPWQERNTNFAPSLNSRGHYRSLFNPGGNYKNFYDIFAMSQADPYHHASVVPTFYSNDETCSETTISLPRKNKEFESYRPFRAESRGYTRSYFYGAGR
ncbi:MAG TPA: hypothetical protein V6C89_21350 [Drouetiella sp.]|jgi:muconolactone delta-isomerase